jgi:hypothetical protein
MDCPAIEPDNLETHVDHDGIVCIPAVRSEEEASVRLRSLLADAYGPEWVSQKQLGLLADANFRGKNYELWLRDGFFEQHCALFHQRPFIWQIWDGLPDGFSALVNYHELAAPNRQGNLLLQKLTYSYIGEWIDEQRKAAKAEVEGADKRIEAAVHLRSELEKIILGNPPFDIFVRWKPLHEQAIGWNPDVNDGVRVNIRPFFMARTLGARNKNSCILRVTPKIKWDKDRGKEPMRSKDDFPWFWGWDQRTTDFQGGTKFDGNRWNDLHYSRDFKQEARTTRIKASTQQSPGNNK